MPTVYVVTHPEATHHVQQLVGGWHDSRLTPRGTGHAGRVADALAARIPEGSLPRVVASDLRRTVETAAVIGDRLDTEVVLDPGLREQSYGAAEGRPAGTLAYRPPPPHGDRLHHHDGVAGSETRWQVASRMYAALERALATEAEHQVVVTHGGCATYLIAAWIRMPVEDSGYVRFKLSPGSITVLHESSSSHDRQVQELNGVAHLAERTPPDGRPRGSGTER